PKVSNQLSLFDMGPAVPAAPDEPHEDVAETIIVQDQAALDSLVAVLNAASGISWDTETTGTDQMTARLVGISLAVEGERAYYIPVGHDSGTQLPLQTVMDALRPPLTNPNIPKSAHNANYDLVMMQRYGVDVSPVGFDTMIAEFLRSADSKFAGLKALARQELGVHMT